ncbi:MAG: hypothetical protein UR66_C0009G0061 [Candidatus Moranbacteria bacterium GW2011_GWE1_35_17]|nr:MAG: hypothetical protein UR66_C0009G0061 [Candidatus Moranbacteria bacterium GW2011_GWE1_35_17]KKP83132.1 MAG: hypothetical protein UR82_C0024G0010 [Candidatus Moranbacteria bacterium GW2011_GWF1_35_5]KKP83998.1 MAG: hypothetical protein UR83_C0029G0031 [Candidatus Moranbacteria bacterium GW2011_GWF2_35_54]
MEKIINIFGDSIAWGAFDKDGGWVDRLKKDSMRDSSDYNIVYNLSIPNEVSDELLKRFQIENEARDPNVIIIAMGVNDSSYTKTKDRVWVPLNRFEENIEELIKISRRFTQDIIFVGLIKVDESKTKDNLPEGMDEYIDNQSVIIYNAKIKEICENNNLLFIEMLDLLNDDDLEDGLHPNSKGHEKMFLRIKDFLVENKIV